MLGAQRTEGEPGRGFVHTEIKQLGFPENVSNHRLHSHPKGGVSADEATTRAY